MILAETYEETYGIADHNDPNRPLSLVAHHAAEDCSESELLFRTLLEFASHELNKVFNISITEYFELPVHVQRSMIKIAVKRAEKLSETLSDLGSDLE